MGDSRQYPDPVPLPTARMYQHLYAETHRRLDLLATHTPWPEVTWQQLRLLATLSLSHTGFAWVAADRLAAAAHSSCQDVERALAPAAAVGLVARLTRPAVAYQLLLDVGQGSR